MSANHCIRELRCYVCGTIVVTSAPRTMCEECRKIRNHEKERLRWAKQKPAPVGYTVIKDPAPPDTAFNKGAVFSCEEHDKTLELKNYTLGTILQDVEGKCWQVVRGKISQELRAWQGVET